MNSTTTILIALTLAILLVAAFYGLSDSVIDRGGDAVENLSDAKEDGEGDTQFSSAEPYLDQKIEDIDTRGTIV